jgi:hypothetical protein
MIITLSADENTSWWFYCVIPTGLSETLAIQQFYLVKLLGLNLKSKADNLRIRELVKKSHTATGVGSAIAFLCSSLVYATSNQLGIGYLGLCVAVVKLAIIIFIGSYLHGHEESVRGDTHHEESELPMQNDESGESHNVTDIGSDPLEQSDSYSWI